MLASETTVDTSYSQRRPEMLVSTSMRFGSLPIIVMRYGFENQRQSRAVSGKPNSRIAAATRRALACVGSTRMSRS
jgi:hypothetical protein